MGPIAEHAVSAEIGPGVGTEVLLEPHTLRAKASGPQPRKAKSVRECLAGGRLLPQASLLWVRAARFLIFFSREIRELNFYVKSYF